MKLTSLGYMLVLTPNFVDDGWNVHLIKPSGRWSATHKCKSKIEAMKRRKELRRLHDLLAREDQKRRLKRKAKAEGKKP